MNPHCILFCIQQAALDHPSVISVVVLVSDWNGNQKTSGREAPKYDGGVVEQLAWGMAMMVGWWRSGGASPQEPRGPSYLPERLRPICPKTK